MRMLLSEWPEGVHGNAISNRTVRSPSGSQQGQMAEGAGPSSLLLIDAGMLRA